MDAQYSAIHKFPLDLDDMTAIEMPEHAQVLCAQDQYGTLCLWAKVTPGAPMVTRYFAIVGTGHSFPSDLAYIDTVQHSGGRLVWHVLEKVT
jgi:hypothetical protein